MHKIDTNLCLEMNRLKRMVLQNNSRGESRKIKIRLDTKQRKLKNLRTARIERSNHEYETHVSKRKREIEINLRAMLAYCYVGTGGQDVASVLYL